MKLHNTFRQNNKAGFTLIEILIVAGLFLILASIGTLIGFDSIGRSSVHDERDLVVLMLTGARTRALANVNEKKQGVRIKANEIVLFELDTSGTETNDRSTPRNSAVTITPAPPFDIVFDRLSANVITGAGAVTLTQDSKTDTIDINEQGRIEW